MSENKSGILVNEYRGDTLDNTHSGYICIVDEKSKICGAVGDPGYYAFYRSAAKPIQALDTAAFGLAEQYGITDEESVIFSSSHAGEPFHAEAIESILRKTELDENLLVMRPCAPTAAAANEARILADLPARKIYHNCAGMHISLMLLQRYLGGEADQYYRIDSIVNRLSTKTVALLSELPEDSVVTAIDGCGVPTFAVPMVNIAASFKNLACVDTIKDDRLMRAAQKYLPYINKYPRMLRGTGYICSLINRDPNVVAKGGAAGVYCIGLRRERLGISLKLADGTENTWPVIIGNIFEQIGYQGPALDTMRALNNGFIYNDCGEKIGYMETAFKL
jgi:L-asparaginase II